MFSQVGFEKKTLGFFFLGRKTRLEKNMEKKEEDGRRVACVIPPVAGICV